MARSKIWARLRGDYVSAGDLYYREGQIERAAAMYAQAGNRLQAARICAEADLPDIAVEYYRQAGALKEAGELLASRGRQRDALQFFDKAGAWWQAAEAASALKDHARAARYYQRNHRFENAAESYERAGELEEALRMWNRESERLSRDTGGGSASAMRRRQVDHHRAQVMAQLGKIDDAVEVLEGCGMHDQVARLLEKVGRYNEAATAYLAADNPQQARKVLARTQGLDARTEAEIYSRAGEYRRAAVIHEELGELADAAEAYEAAGEWGAAAGLWEKRGDPGRAAELFYRAGELEEAARCYARAKDYRLAADTYIRVKSYQDAADCLLEAGDLLKAAQCLLEAKDEARAAEVLQRIQDTSPAYETATLMLVPLLIKDRLYEGALHRLQLLGSDSSSSTYAVERLYWEGRAYDALSRLADAERAYEHAAALRRDHRDVAARLISLRQRMARAGIKSQPPERNRRPVGVLEPGLELAGRYEILEEIGRGGMGRVYKARDKQLGEIVAIKTLIPRSGDHLRSEHRLRREVQICRRISHPNVVRVFDIGGFDGGLFVSMELLDGESLSELIEREERVPLDVARRLFRDILTGLSEAHRLGVIHRDLKPANVALTSAGAKIMDFGIAYTEDADVSLTQTGQVVGSPMYMSPEQIQGHDLDHRTDLYSFGVLAYTTLVGSEPFHGKNATAVSLKHLQKRPPSLLAHRPDAHDAWEAMVHRLLAKKPGDRYAHAAEVLRALDALPV